MEIRRRRLDDYARFRRQPIWKMFNCRKPARRLPSFVCRRWEISSGRTSKRLAAGKIKTRRFRGRPTRRKNFRATFRNAFASRVACVCARHVVSGARLAGVAASPAGRVDQLWPFGGNDWPTCRLARRGRRRGSKSAGVSHPLPSRYSRDRNDWELPLGPNPQAYDDCLGEFMVCWAEQSDSATGIKE